SCQTANCFNKSKGVFITDPKLKALLNPQPSWGFSGHKKGRHKAAFRKGVVPGDFEAGKVAILRFLSHSR
ncbi:hypothetical protein, partial [Yersinia pestis]|uniref:hypothetical protein n=4 Tax=Yersinia pestis TaxID=632 RepID=UPI001D1003D2